MARVESIVRPDFEVSIFDAKGNPALVAGIFIEASGKVDVGLGWDGETELRGLAAILQAVALSLETSIAWASPDDIMAENIKRKSEGDEIPF